MALLCLALIVGSLSACGGSSTNPNVSTNVTEGILSAPDSLLPEVGGSYDDLLVENALWAPLYYGDDSGIIPAGLAAQMPQLSNNDQTYTIALRPGLKWSDGTPLTAIDVVFTLKLFVANATLLSRAPSSFGEITSVESPDTQTVSITLRVPDSTFLAYALTDASVFAPLPQTVFAGIKPSHLFAKKSSQNLSPTVVSGPYLIQSPNPQQVVLTPNFRYYQGPPAVDKLYFPVFGTSSTLLQAMRDGQIDLTSDITVDDYAKYRQASAADNHITTHTAETSSAFEALYFNLHNQYLARQGVRQALTEAIDDTGIIAAITNNRGQPQTVPTCDDAVGTFAHPTRLPPCYKHDVNQAKADLSAAGVTGRFTLHYLADDTSPAHALIAQLVAQQLQQIGITMAVSIVSSNDFYNRLSTDQYDIAETGFSLGYDPHDSVLWGCSDGVNNNGFNLSHYCSATVDAVLKQDLQTTDQLKRKSLLDMVHTAILEDVPAMFLYVSPTVTCACVGLDNYRPSAFNGDTWNVWQWRIRQPNTAERPNNIDFTGSQLIPIPKIGSCR
jgi:peptide/nickel transport system substrate-binding protein